jgi:hypothetical protein
MIPPYSVWERTRNGPYPRFVIDDVPVVIRKAFKTGQLKRQPCVVCGRENGDVHHFDYERPLDVTFLCQRHHNELHRCLTECFRYWRPRQYTRSLHEKVLQKVRHKWIEPELPFVPALRLAVPGGSRHKDSKKETVGA